MFSWAPQFRLLLPLLLTSTISFLLCVATAVFLLREQSLSVDALGETIAAYRASTKLEESLLDLIALLGNKVEDVHALHARIDAHLASLRRSARSADESTASDTMASSFRSYLVVWRSLPATQGEAHQIARREAIGILENQTLKTCQELREELLHQIDASQEDHRSTVRGLAWGLAVVGATAVLAGLALGYGVARGLHQSIRRLQIGIRDAAGKLQPNLPVFEIRGNVNLNDLNDEMQFLSRRIENTVEQLHQRERELLRAEQLAAVGQLAAGMAHEIRNPLMSIKMLIQTAREEGTPGALSSEDLVVIEREIRQMQRSIQSFLDFARPPKLLTAETDIATVIERTVELIRGRAEKQRVAIVVDLPPTIPTLKADANQLQQVVLNLTLNALDAMPTGGTMTLAARVSGDWMDLCVRDTGPGISVEDRGRAFQPFFTTKPTGLGLGLVISRRIVEDHGGRMELDPSTTEAGACFRILLPITRETIDTV